MFQGWVAEQDKGRPRKSSQSSGRRAVPAIGQGESDSGREYAHQMLLVVRQENRRLDLAAPVIGDLGGKTFDGLVKETAWSGRTWRQGE